MEDPVGQFRAAIEAGEVASIVELWRAHGAWREHDTGAARRRQGAWGPLLDGGPGLGLAGGRRLVSIGESFAALEIARDLIEAHRDRKEGPWGDDTPARLLLGQALARSGATTEAGREADLLVARRPDEETLGLRARVLKDLALQQAPGPGRRAALLKAAAAYGDGFRATGAYWHLVNAATLSLLAGDPAADQLAREAEQITREHLASGASGYWVLATLGEAALVQGHLDRACEWYRRAHACAAGPGDLMSTWRNARLVTEHLGLSVEAVDLALPRPRPIVFSGHMIDRPGRLQPRFPASLEGAVAAALRDRIGRLAHPGGAVGYAQAACGADLLFLDAMIEAGHRIRVVLPYERARFVEASVEHGGAHWRERFERVLKAADEVIVAAPQSELGDANLYHYANLVMLGLATAHARRNDRPLGALAVWDGLPGDGLGGTFSNVGLWGEKGHDVHVVDLARLRGEPGLRGAAGEPVEVIRPGELSAAYRGVTGTSYLAVSHSADDSVLFSGFLFGDVVGFSKLPETAMPRFVERVLGGAAEAVRRAGCRMVYANTWGDGIFLAFDDARTAASAALAIRDAVASLEPLGNARIEIRIGLHAGPVWQMDDPFTGRPAVFGTQLTRAARIEPIVQPGEVYASELFVALMGLEGEAEFACEPVGARPLAKGYGREQLYHVRRALA